MYPAFQVTAEPGEETVEINANDKEPELDAVSKLWSTPGIINTRILTTLYR